MYSVGVQIPQGLVQDHGHHCIIIWRKRVGGFSSGLHRGLGIKSVLKDFGFDVSIKVLSDSSAAIGMSRRLGLGRVRHLAVADLWVQQALRDRLFSISKCHGYSNGADLMTKTKGRADLLRLLHGLL